MKWPQDARIAHAGPYNYCRRCGATFPSPKHARWHFGDRKYHAGGVKGQEYARIHCSGIPDGFPKPNPAPGTKSPDLEAQEVPTRYGGN